MLGIKDEELRMCGLEGDTVEKKGRKKTSGISSAHPLLL